MYIVYYSHAKNTERFVSRHLLAALTKDTDIPVEELPLRSIRIFANSPQTDADGITFPTKSYESREEAETGIEKMWVPLDQTILWVTPTYGKFNHQIHRAENFTPKPVRDAMKAFEDHPSPQFVAVGGNRTFGFDFAKQDRIPENVVGVGAFELSGSETEAKNIAANLAKELARV